MEMHFLITFLFLALVTSHAAVEPEVYLKSMLPKSPMPKAIKDLLPNEASFGKVDILKRENKQNPSSSVPLYDDAASNEQLKDTKLTSLFFLENEIHLVQNVTLHITKDTSGATTFIPRQVAESLPFTSNQLLNIYEKFSFKPDSREAKLIKKTINECEKASIQGEEKYCATSLESMVDFITLKLGKNVKAIATEVNGKRSDTIQEYRVEGVKKLATNKAIVCHKQYYVYAVFLCHKTTDINAYMVSLVGEDNTTAKAVAICHEKTTSWNLKHLAFDALNVKPGTASICHFLVEDELAWVPY